MSTQFTPDPLAVRRMFSDDEFNDILNRSGRNERNRVFLRHLKQALPEIEWLAVSAWISTFFGYQQDWLLDSSNMALLVKSRQSGGSFTYAAVGVLWAMIGEKTAIVSVGQREADRVLEYAKKHIQALVKLGSRWAIPTASNAERIIISSGGQVTSLPPTSGARGDSTNVILDEAAYYKNPSPEKVIESAFGATTHKGYRIRILSTPNGVGNKFFDLCKDSAKLGYRLHSITIEQAIADGIEVNLDDCWKKASMDPRIFGQMYGCSFLDSEFQYISTSLIDGVRCKDPFPLIEDEPYFAGLDIGRTNDLTVLLTLQRVMLQDKRHFVLRGMEYRKRTSEDDLKKMVADGFERYNYRRLALDATGIGAFPSESMVKRHGHSRVDPIHFTMQVKEELATGMYVTFAEKRLILPDIVPGIDSNDLLLLRQDVASIQRIVTDKGNVTYDAPTTSTGHADRAWALALALNACINAPTYARLS